MKDVKELLEFYKNVRREVYLDLENCSPVPKEILDEMLPYFNKKAYGNPTVTHRYGWEAYEAIMEASEKISKYIGGDSPEDITFTPGETEANNLALMGAASANKTDRKKIIISSIEPLSIINTAKIMERYGYKVLTIPVDGEGFVNLDRLADMIDSETFLVSIMMVNHEIGTVEPVKEAVEIVKDKDSDIIFHTDASDRYGRLAIDVKKLGVDIMTLSSYKILGPRGVGALYVRNGVEINRILEGQVGTQNLWPGVENTPLIVGFRKASELAFENFDDNIIYMKRLRDKLINGILGSVPDTFLNGPKGDKRSPDNVNISFLHAEGEALTIELSLKGIYVSSGSACTRRMLQPSHVLTSIGKEYEEAHGSILMKISRYHSDDDIEYVLRNLPVAVERIRKISPSIGGEVNV